MPVLRHLRRRASGSTALRRPATGLLAAAGAAVLACAVATPIAAAAAPSVYVANESAGTLSVIDTASSEVRSLTVGSLPQAVAISPDGTTVYVTNQGSGSVSVIDAATGQVVDSITVGLQTESLPEGIAVAPDGSSIYVTYGYRPGTGIGPGEVAVIDASTRQVTTRIRVADDPAGIAVTPDGTRAFVAGFGSGQITMIEGLNGPEPTARPPLTVGGTPQGVAVTPDGATVYVSNGNLNGVSVVDALTGTLRATLSDTGLRAPQGIAISPDGTGSFVAAFDGGELIALDPDGGVLGSAGIGTNPFAVAYSPDGKTVYATSSTAPGSVRAIDAATRAPVGGPIGVADNPLGLAITPDQAPVAKLAVSARSATNPTQFDASASTVRFGTIESYAWDFGDGTGATTTAPTVSHTYAEPGIYTASVTATDSAGTSTQRVFTGQTVSRNGGPSATAARSVTIVAPRPLASLTPTSLDFGEQTMSQLYLSKPVTLASSGDAPLRIDAVMIAGSDAGSFALADDHCSGGELAPGAECLVEVRFLPTSIGSKTATLRIADDAAGSPHTVSLAGVGLGPTVEVSPPRLDFPDRAPGSDSAPRRITVTNGGNDPLNVSELAPAGRDATEFAVVAETCTAAPVAPQASCEVEVEFRPASFGDRNALVRLDDDAPGAPHVAAVTGSGVGSQATFSTARLSFAERPVGTRSPAQAVTVTNSGNAPLHVQSALLGGTGAGAFTLSTDACSGETVAPRASCTLEVSFGAATAGDYVARLSLLDDGVGGSPGVALDGRATAPAGGGHSGPGPATGPPATGGPGALPRPPRVRVRGAAPRRRTWTRLKGLVNPAGQVTTYRFQWGATRRYGHLTPRRRLRAGTGWRRVATRIARLHPGATYHYRLIATNPAGTVRSRDRKFRVPRRVAPTRGARR